MKIDNINIGDTIKKAQAMLRKEKNISPALQTVFELLLILMQAMLERFSLNSGNSGKPPSSDPNRKKKTKKSTDKSKSNKKPGGQPGRKGSQLKPVDNPDRIKDLKIGPGSN